MAFRAGSSVVVVCPYCRSAVARTDRELRDMGKVAAIVATNSPLAVGMTGRYQGHSFQLTGRTQLKHQLGGVWDEWYAAFSDGRWGWLAEAQGRFFLTFETPLPLTPSRGGEGVGGGPSRGGEGTGGGPPSREQLVLGQGAPGLPGGLLVAELGQAAYAAAEGEIPFLLKPGTEYGYADLAGPGGEFATLDFSEARPRFYCGWEVPLAELHVVSAGSPERIQQVKAVRLGCPKCGGSVDLRAPDKSERVVCPHCGSLLDCTQGALAFLQALSRDKISPLIPLGATAEFEKVKLVVIGFVVRSCKIEGTNYHWHEYLLYDPGLGFRWLVHSDKHWTYVQPVAPGLVRDFKRNVEFHIGRHIARDVEFRGRRYKRFQDAQAVVEYVMGEFYWKVEVGETVLASDFIAPPYMLSREEYRYGYTGAKGPQRPGGEINWSLGEYVTPAEIKAKFKLANVPQPQVVGACQPFPCENIHKPWAALSAIACALILIVHLTAPPTEVYRQACVFKPAQNPAPNPASNPPQSPAPNPAQGTEGSQVMFSEPFELQAGRNIYVQCQASVDNTWVYLDGDLIQEDTDLVQTFGLPIEYYHGSDSDGAWSEGSQEQEVFLSALPAGKYSLRLEAQWERKTEKVQVWILVLQGVPRVLHDILLLVLLSVVPLMILLANWSWEKRRWAESMYGPS